MLTNNKTSMEDIFSICFSTNSIFQQILLNTFDCLIFLKQGKVIYINPKFEELIGYKLSDITDKSGFLKLIHVDDRCTLEALLESLEQHHQSCQQILRIVNSNEEIKWLKAQTMSIINNEDHYILIAAHDITDHHYMQNQLLQAQKMGSISQMAPGLAHEFNNQLKGILGLSSHLLNKMPQGHPYHREVSLIVQVTEQASELISQLLDFSRNAQFNPKVVNPNKIVSEVTCFFSHTINPQIGLELRLDPEIKHIKADYIQLKHVLFNLLINGRDALNEDGLMTIRTENINLTEPLIRGNTTITPGEYVLISVHDNGIGMDNKTLNKIFEPFFTRKSKQQGTGLGMTIVREIVNRHNGYITVESELGSFTNVSIYLPITFEENDNEVDILNLDEDFIKRYLSPEQQQVYAI